jgi:hypothetical protein
MVKVSMEVRSGAARFQVAVRAESIQRAVSLVETILVRVWKRGRAVRDPAPPF